MVAAISVDDDRDRPLPPVQSFDSANTTADEIVAALIKAGGCIIRNAVHSNQLAAIEKDTRPYIEKDRVWGGEFFPRETRRVTALAEKSKAFMENVVCCSLYQQVCDVMLSSTTKSWLDEVCQVSTSKPQLNTTIVFSIGPGARDQGLHRDDMIHHNVTKRMLPEEYTIGQDLGIGIFVAGKKTTKENGATRFIPGSHLWDAGTPPSQSLAYYAELDPGDAFIMLSSCLHGGSANTTTDEERLVYCAFMTKGFLRQVSVQTFNSKHLETNHQSHRRRTSTWPTISKS